MYLCITTILYILFCTIIPASSINFFFIILIYEPWLDLRLWLNYKQNTPPSHGLYPMFTNVLLLKSFRFVQVFSYVNIYQ